MGRLDRLDGTALTFGVVAGLAMLGGIGRISSRGSLALADPDYEPLLAEVHEAAFGYGATGERYYLRVGRRLKSAASRRGLRARAERVWEQGVTDGRASGRPRRRMVGGSPARLPWRTLEDVTRQLKHAPDRPTLERRFEKAQSWWEEEYPYPIDPRRNAAWSALTDAYDEAQLRLLPDGDF